MISLLFVHVITSIVVLLFLSLGVFAVLRVLDKASGFNFKANFEAIKSNPIALAIYLGCRILGVTLAMGMIVVLLVVL